MSDEQEKLNKEGNDNKGNDNKGDDDEEDDRGCCTKCCDAYCGCIMCIGKAIYNCCLAIKNCCVACNSAWWYPCKERCCNCCDNK